ncbi:hypothetical protein, partial [Prevotella sp. HMSC073D09]|uniref:hypothetical protein n=1 Tax=Prevotella sp. HMSC073D09 TaxID=1739459 RepID=UPI0009F29C1D
PLLAPKISLFNENFVLSGHISISKKWFVYTIAAYIYAFCLTFCTAFSTFLPCILHQNALHFAPKRIAFCTILHYI